jgi:hypothetical protein
LILEHNLFDVFADEYLGAYPYSSWKKWVSLSHRISEGTLQRLEPFNRYRYKRRKEAYELCYLQYYLYRYLNILFGYDGFINLFTAEIFGKNIVLYYKNLGSY